MATITSLFDAVQDGNLKAIREFLQGNQGLDVNTIRGNYDRTPLHVACKHGKLEIAKLLIQDNNADANAVDVNGCTPLISSCCTYYPRAKVNYTAVVELLLENGANVNTRSNSGSTALLCACRRGQMRVVELLLNHGADINVQSIRGETPLHYACYHPHIEMIKLLLASNADRHVKNTMGQEPAELLQACANGHYEVFTSYDKLPLAVSGLDKTRTSSSRKKRKRTNEMVRLNQHLSQHQHTLALKLPVHEVAYEVLGFLTPTAIEKIFLPTV